jgi:peptide/nickel transport system substrate-binding protein
MPESLLSDDKNRTAWASYDPEHANKLLDEIGLDKRDGAGVRLMKDGRPLELLVEVDGEAADLIDALQITAEFWMDIGVKLLVKPQEASNLRQRSYSGRTLMVAAQGLDNALPTPVMPPSELAPMRQDNYAWPQWGQYVETRGKAGEAADTPDMKELMGLWEKWLRSSETTEKRSAWQDMLRMHAENQYVIGTVAGSIQPIVVSSHLRNVPRKAIFSWEPTAMLGAYRVDEFWFDDQPESGPSQ